MNDSDNRNRRFTRYVSAGGPKPCNDFACAVTIRAKHIQSAKCLISVLSRLDRTLPQAALPDVRRTVDDSGDSFVRHPSKSSLVLNGRRRRRRHVAGRSSSRLESASGSVSPSDFEDHFRLASIVWASCVLGRRSLSLLPALAGRLTRHCGRWGV